MDIIKEINNKIDKNIKACFLSGIIIGWITHFYMLTHKLPNWDDISNINDLGQTKTIGRWLIEPLQYFGLKASNPAIHGMLLIVFVSLAACFVVAALDLKSLTSAVLVPAVMITFPSITSILYFMFTAHIYAVSIFLLCVSVYLIRKFRYGFIASGICIILGLAIYQPFVSVAISLMLIGLILDAIRGEKFKNLTKKGFICAGTLALSTVVYIIVSRIIYPQMDEATYGGVGEMGQVSLFEIPKNFGRVYKRVLEYFVIRPFAYITKTMHITNICVCVMILILLISLIMALQLWKKRLELAFLLLMLFFFPFGMGFVYFMAPNAPFSTLMLYAYSLIYVLLIALSEEYLYKCAIASAERRKISTRIMRIEAITTVALLLLCAYSGYLVDSQAYFRTDIAMQRVTNYYNRIISRVESMEGYQTGDRVAVLGNFYYKTNPSPMEIDIFRNDDIIRELDGVALENGLITMGVRSMFISTYMGFNPERVPLDELVMLEGTDEYKSMPVYPQDGSIARIEDVWVVKLCD